MPEYRFKETKLNCPKCKKGKARLVISRKEGKEYKFFRCSEYDCDWNGGFYNQDNNKIDIIDNCPSCDGILYVRNGKNGPFLGCSHFPDCKQTRELTEEEGRLLDEKSLDGFIGDKLDSKGANPLGNDKKAEKNPLSNEPNKEEAEKNTPINDPNKEEDGKSSPDNPLNKEEAV